MKKTLYILLQCTWGILQTLIGAIVFLINIKKKHYSYHGAVVTETDGESSISLGLFLFVAKDKKRNSASKRLLIHEYGHTLQSLMLGPLYLIVIGIPSASWALLPYFEKKRSEQGISYYSFCTERSADKLGQRITKEKII